MIRSKQVNSYGIQTRNRLRTISRIKNRKNENLINLVNSRTSIEQYSQCEFLRLFQLECLSKPFDVENADPILLNAVQMANKMERCFETKTKKQLSAEITGLIAVGKRKHYEITTNIIELVDNHWHVYNSIEKAALRESVNELKNKNYRNQILTDNNNLLKSHIMKLENERNRYEKLKQEYQNIKERTRSLIIQILAIKGDVPTFIN